MLLRIFRSNQPYTIFLVAVLAFVVTIPLYFSGYRSVVPTYSPLRSLFEEIDLSGIWIPIVTGVLIFLAAVIADRVFNRHEFMSDRHHLPGMWYPLLVMPFLAHPSIIPILIANIFILIGIGRLVQVFRQPRVLAQYFEAGFWIGMASLFYMPFLIALPLLLLCIIFTRTFNGHEMTIPLVGAFVPWFFFASISFILSDAILLGIDDPTSFPLSFENGFWLYLFIAALLWQLLVGLVRWFGSYKRSSNRSKNTKSVFLIFGAGVLLSSLPLLLVDSFLPLAALASSLPFILSFSSMKQRRDWLPKLYLSISILSLVLLFVLPFLN